VTRCNPNPASSSAEVSATTTTAATTTATTTSTSTSSVSAALSTPTGSGTKFGQIASSTFYNETTSNTYVYVYYQDGPNIMYTVYPGSKGFSTPQILALPITPKAGTPLSATAYDDGDGKGAVRLPHANTFNLPS
jgi:hypothetical protein